MKKISVKQTPTKITTTKQMKEREDTCQRTQVKSSSTKKCKRVQKMFEKCEHGCMAIYGWLWLEDKYVVPKRDNEWLKYLFQKKKSLYKHTDTPGERYDMLIDRT